MDGAVFELADGALPAVAQMQAQVRVDALQAALAGLPERQRIAGYCAISTALPIPRSPRSLASRSRRWKALARGRRALRETLGVRRNELGFEDD